MLKSKMVSKARRFSLEKEMVVFFPASPPSRKVYQKVSHWLKKSGLNFRIEKIIDFPAISSRSSAQVEQLLNLFSDPEVGAIWAGRGGYGSNYLLSQLEKSDFTPEKIFVGSSDLTFLLLFLVEKKNLTCFYAPMPFTGAYKLFSAKRLKRYFVLGEKIALTGKVLIPGASSGVLKGGCLTNLVTLSGTRFWPDLQQTILFLEDVHERPYRLERMVWQLSESKGFEKVRGIIFGRLIHCFKNRQEKEIFFFRLKELLDPLKIPVGYDFPFGHINRWYLLPLGVKASLQGSEENLWLKVEEEYLQ